MEKKYSFGPQAAKVIIIACIAWMAFNFFTAQAMQFLPVLAEYKGLIYADLLIWNTVGNLVGAAVSVASTVLIQRFGAKQMIGVAAIIAGVNFLLMPIVPAATVGICIIINVAASVLYCTMSTGTLIVAWFQKKNSSVMGWVTGAIIISSLVLLPLFNRCLGNFGVQKAFLIFGVLFVVYGVITLIIIKNTPDELGLEPDNIPRTEEEKKLGTVSVGAMENPWTFGKIFTNRSYLLMMIGWGFVFLAFVGVGMTAIPFFMAQGMDQLVAVRLVAIAGVMNLLGSVSSGYVGEKVGIRTTNLIFLLIQVIGVALMAFAGAGMISVMVLGYMLFSFMLGAPSNLVATQSMQLIGPKYFTKVYGILYMVMMLIRSLGSTVISISLTQTGGYQTGLTVIFVGVIIGTIFVFIAGTKYQTPPALKK